MIKAVIHIGPGAFGGYLASYLFALGIFPIELAILVGLAGTIIVAAISVFATSGDSNYDVIWLMFYNFLTFVAFAAIVHLVILFGLYQVTPLELPFNLN